jgi:hypothetical protein
MKTKPEPPTHAIANKGFSGLRSSSPASSFVSVDSFVLRNPLLAIASTLAAIIKTLHV